MHDSLTPLGGLVPMVNIELGEVIFGGVGSGLYGMLMFAVLAVFIAGLMVGRTPEYLGKKIEQKEVKMMMLSVLVLAFSILGFSGAGVGLDYRQSSLGNHGPHGLSEILYAYSSATGNNGSAFGGISANTPYLNTTLGLAMLFGRFLMMIPLLAAAGSLAQKKQTPVSAGTFPTHGPLFVFLLVAVTLIVGALTFFPGALARTHRRAFPNASRKALELTNGNRTRTSASADRRQHVADIRKGPARAAAVRPAHRAARHRRFVPQAAPAAHDEEPGHVRRGSGRRR